MSIKVLLVDDQAMVRAGIHMILEAENDIRVAGEAEDGAKAVINGYPDAGNERIGSHPADHSNSR